MNMQTNIDEIRERIMRLEDALTFDQLAWDMVLADLRAAGRLSALADAERRMDTAKRYQPMHVRTDLGMGGEDEIDLVLVPVAVETEDPWICVVRAQRLDVEVDLLAHQFNSACEDELEVQHANL